MVRVNRLFVISVVCSFGRLTWLIVLISAADYIQAKRAAASRSSTPGYEAPPGTLSTSSSTEVLVAGESRGPVDSRIWINQLCENGVTVTAL